MKITAVAVRDYMKIRDVTIRPGERALLSIAGRNRQGKSSIINALEVAVGGARYAGPEPVRHGAKSAAIDVELDDGKLTISRTIAKDGRQVLEVREDGVKRRSPQALLDALIGARFLDPLKFLRATAREQRELLLNVAKIDYDLDDAAAKRAAAYDRRREVGRDLSRAQASREQLGPPEQESAANADVEAIRARYDELVEGRRRIEQARERMAAIDEEGKRIAAEIDRLKHRRLELKNDWRKANAIANGGPDNVEALIEDAKREQAEAIQAVSKSAAARGRNEQRTRLDGELAQLSSEHGRLQATIDKIDSDKAAALAAAEMPIAGLDVADDHVVYNGAPLQQASDAERLAVSLAIATTLSPELRDVWVRDGSLLDDQSMEAMRRFAQERDVRIWIERVGTGDDEAIVIEDGEVQE